MPLVTSKYTAPFFLPNGHFQTIFPALFRKIPVIPNVRERITTADNDFLDLDWSFSQEKTDKLAILSHGLEGSSSSPYLVAMKRYLSSQGMDTVAWNMRGCSGEINRCLRFYHSGETSDLDYVIRHCLSTGRYRQVYLTGFSLGGNVTLKYLGEQGGNLHKEIVASVAISVPCHLASAAENLARWQNSIYLKRFLKSLKNKVKLKAPSFPSDLDITAIDRIKNFLEFDNRYTAPLHGFKDASEYWEMNSSCYFLHNIQIPTLLLNAANDPFLSSECFPRQEGQSSKYFFVEIPDQGGHCGFLQSGSVYYSEQRTAEFFREFGRLRG